MAEITIKFGFGSISGLQFREDIIKKGGQLLGGGHIGDVKEIRRNGKVSILGRCVPEASIRKTPYTITLELNPMIKSFRSMLRLAGSATPQGRCPTSKRAFILTSISWSPPCTGRFSWTGCPISLTRAQPWIIWYLDLATSDKEYANVANSRQSVGLVGMVVEEVSVWQVPPFQYARTLQCG